MPELKRVVASFVSLVDKPAIRKKFLLQKAEKGGANMPNSFSEKGPVLLSERINVAHASEEEVLTKVAEIRKAAGQPFGEEELDVARALLRVAGASDAPVEKRAESVVALMGGVVEKMKGKCPECGAMIDTKDMKDMQKGETRCPQCVKKAEEPKVADPVMKAQLESVIKENQSLKERVEKMESDKRHAEAVKKAASANVPVETEKLATLIEKAEAAGIGDELVSTLAALGKQIEAGNLFAELGSSRVAEGSSIAKMEGMAREMVVKSSDSKLTFEQALVVVAEQHPELYVQYQAERGVK